MEKAKKGLKIGVMVALFSLMAAPAFARPITLKGAGISLWVFVIIGSIIVLLQLIPATILFFSFVGATAHRATRKGRTAEDEAILPGTEPVV
ncbi:MAG TPA: hypothetical protein VLZ10_00530 [Thermodesulfobacteriota bacterium]|nr:hypothetical protein [Thermodesulfobacteriota bacterium]